MNPIKGSTPVPGYISASEIERINEPSDYLLTLFIEDDMKITVGALGKTFFRKGTYIYTGSAKGGLRVRVKRHLGVPGKKRWHIDHLTSVTSEKSIWWKPHEDEGECRSASELAERYEAVPGFGCSDCRCGSHLFWAGEERRFLQDQVQE
ncbi:MAG: GIY-YIG nuclease family protein [Thermoplasmatota archaeon]